MVEIASFYGKSLLPEFILQLFAGILLAYRGHDMGSIGCYVRSLLGRSRWRWVAIYLWIVSIAFICYVYLARGGRATPIYCNGFVLCNHGWCRLLFPSRFFVAHFDSLFCFWMRHCNYTTFDHLEKFTVSQSNWRPIIELGMEAACVFHLTT